MSVTDKINGVQTSVVMVNPAQAIKWLEGNTHNRPIRDSVVLRYAEDMKAGRWRQTHQGIAFDEKGVLIDGQHRLYAVVESNVSVVMQVTKGLPIDAQVVIDDHLRRTVVDVLKLADSDREGLSNMHISVVSRMVRGVAARTTAGLTRQETQAQLEAHWDATCFAVGLFPKSRVVGISRASVIATIARASYSQDHAKLKRFAEILVTGLSAGAAETVVITLRNWLLMSRKPGGAMDDEVYGKTTRALMAYLRGEKIRTLYATRDDLFPLPLKRKR